MQFLFPHWDKLTNQINNDNFDCCDRFGVLMIENVYTPKEYANEICHGKVTCQTVRNWIKKWMSTGGIPKNHRLETTPSGRVLIVINNEMKPQSDLLNLLVSNR